MIARAALLLLVVGTFAGADNPGDVRKEIEASYAKALDALRQAKTIDDLDELNRTFDTADWRSISPGQNPRTWQDLRQYGIDGLRAPFQHARFVIHAFELNGDTAVVTGHLHIVNMNGQVGIVPLKETFRKTIVGWKRSVHQKFAAGEIPH